MPSTPASPTKLRKRAVFVCIVTTATVAVMQIVIGRRFELISVTAEGLHTGADLLDSLIALVLVLIASRPADPEHPYGHGKFDSLAAIIEGCFVGAAALWAILKASQVLLGFAQTEPRPELVTIAAMAAASVIYLVASSYVLDVARRTHSPAVHAEGLHLRTHIYITIGLAIGLAMARVWQSRQWPHADRIDPLVAMILGTFLLTVAYRIVRPGLSQLMDAALPTEELEEIAACLSEFRGEFVEIHAIRARRSGTDRHVDIHLMVPAETTVQRAHDLSHRIEHSLSERHPGTRLLVHIEPAMGRPLAEYLNRDRSGLVVSGPADPTAREPSHHHNDQAHEV